jgi:uncharacterized protein (TIGR02145 family)
MKRYSIFFIFGLILLVFLQACEKPIRVAAVETNEVSNVSYSSVSLLGIVIDVGEGSLEQHGFCYGIAPDVSKNEDQFVELGSINATLIFIHNLTGLIAGTDYFIRAYVQDNTGIYYGREKQFRTLEADVPTVSTDKVSNIEANSAVCGGIIINDGGSSITERGVCISTSSGPTISDRTVAGTNSDGGFSCTLNNLAFETKYYVKAYASNSNGPGYGEEETFTTIVNYVSDYDANQYKTVDIGLQTWMTEDLKTTHYLNGDLIPDGSTAGDISSVSDPGYRFNYDNGITSGTTYGKLYTWNVVEKSSGICPEGWHIPTDGEWKILASYLGGKDTAGGKMKETGNTLWRSPNADNASNESGFSALPSGMRVPDGTFKDRGNSAYYWSSTEYDNFSATAKVLDHDKEELSTLLNSSKSEGLSIRCIKD